MGIITKPQNVYSATLLCVDDEPSVLESLKRFCRAHHWRAICAKSGNEALELIRRERVEVIISDMRMPGMSGAELLSRARVNHPDIERIMLTGFADIEALSTGINDAAIHGYVTKPWDEQMFVRVIKSALESHKKKQESVSCSRRTNRENSTLKALNKDLYRKLETHTTEMHRVLQRNTDPTHSQYNLSETLKILSQLLEHKDHSRDRHCRAVCELACHLGSRVGIDKQGLKQLYIASLLHDIGHLSLPDDITNQTVDQLKPHELARYKRHPQLAETALINAPSLKPIASIIRSHHEHIDGTGFPDGLSGDQIPLNSRIIAIVSDYQDLRHGHLISQQYGDINARKHLLRHAGKRYDRLLVNAFLSLLDNLAKPQTTLCMYITSRELKLGMQLVEDLISSKGSTLLTQGTVITAEMIQTIHRQEENNAEGFTLQVCPAAEPCE